MLKTINNRQVYVLRKYQTRENSNVWKCLYCGRLFIKHKMFFDYKFLRKPDKTYCPTCLAYYKHKIFWVAT